MAGYQKAVLALTLALFTACLGMDLDGSELISARPNSVDQASYLINLQTKYPQLDLWELPEQNRSSPFLVPANLLDEVKELMRQQHIQWNVTSTDVVQLLKEYEEEDNAEVPMAGIDVTFHKRYHSVEQARIFLKALAALYPKNMKLGTLKTLTVEGETIPALELTGTSKSNKKAILIQGGIHAREWISPAVNFYAIEQMLKGYVANKDWARKMLDDYDWYFVPLLNIDGYAYTRSHSRARLWRKNRRRIIRNWCYGVDLNRNFDSNHGTIGTSSDCRDDIFPGSKPFSEPETRAYRDLFNSLKSRLVAQMSVHAFSQFILVPFGYSPDGSKPANDKELRRVGTKIQQAIFQNSGLHYKLGTPFEILKYGASGAGMDWALAEKPGLYTYSMEMRPDKPNPGFLLPANQIIPTGEEFIAVLRALSTNIKV